MCVCVCVCVVMTVGLGLAWVCVYLVCDLEIKEAGVVQAPVFPEQFQRLGYTQPSYLPSPPLPYPTPDCF